MRWFQARILLEQEVIDCQSEGGIAVGAVTLETWFQVTTTNLKTRFGGYIFSLVLNILSKFQVHWPYELKDMIVFVTGF